MKKVFLIISLFWAIVAQAQLTFTSPVSYWTGVPVGAPSLKGSRIAANLLTNRLYQWDSTNLTWDLLSFGIDEISGISSPAYTPGIGDSPFAINKKTPNPELYYYFSGSWKLVGGGGGGGTSYTAGEGIAIDGTVIRIDTLDRLSFNTLPTLPGGIGTFQWNDTDGTLDLGMKGGNVTLQVGQESLARVVNKSGTTINNGQIVYVSGAQGNRIAVRIASASSDSTTNTVLGIATEEILNNQEGYVTTEGLVRGLNTSAFPEGSALYLSPTVPGGITAILPTAPNHEVVVGYCVRQHATVGIIYASVENGEGLNELHDVKLTSPTNGQVLTYSAANNWWQNSTPTTGTVTSVGLSLPSIFTVSGSPVTTSGTLTGTLATQTANTIFAGPTTGAAAVPTFRSLVAADVTAAGSVTGTGTTNYLPKFTGASAVGNSQVFDNGTNVGIGTATPGQKLDINGTANASEYWLSGFSYTRMALTASGGGFMGGYNLKASAGEPVHDSNGSLSGYRYTVGGVLLFASTSQVAGTAATPKAHLSSTGLGIGLQNPAASLHVQGNGTGTGTFTARFHNSTGTNNALMIRDDGNVGIGTGSPGQKLDINGITNSGEYWVNSTSYSRVAIPESTGGFMGGYNLKAATGLPVHDSNGSLSGYRYTPTGVLLFASTSQVAGTAATPKAHLSSTGLAIGLQNPAASLHVQGNGSTSSTFNSRFANSSGLFALSTRDDRAVIFDNLSGTGNRLMQLDATGIAARSTIDPATVVTEASITGTFATSTTSTTLTGTNFCIRMSAATNIVLTVDANMVEGRLYTVRATDNATNTVTISSGAGHTLAVDLDTTLSPTSYVCASAEIVRLVRYGTIIFIDK